MGTHSKPKFTLKFYNVKSNSAGAVLMKIRILRLLYHLILVLFSIFVSCLRWLEQITTKFSCACWFFTIALFMSCKICWCHWLMVIATLASLINLQNNLLFVQFIAKAAVEIFLFVHLNITEKLTFSFRVLGCSFSDFLEVVGRNELLSAFQ